MSASNEDRKFYIRAPSLDYPTNGPIKIGNILKDAFDPVTTIAMLDPLPKIINAVPYGDGKKDQENHASAAITLSAKIYEAFGGQAGAKKSSALKTVYEWDMIAGRMLERNPMVSDMEALRKKNTAVQSALKKGPVYIITGLKIAKGLRWSNVRTQDKSAELGASTKITEHAAIEGKMKGSKGGEGTEQNKSLGNVVLAYQLLMVRQEGRKWRGEAALEVKMHDPGNAGFMNRDETSVSTSLEAVPMIEKDAKYFAEEEEIGCVQSLGIEDDEGEWSLLYVED